MGDSGGIHLILRTQKTSARAALRPGKVSGAKVAGKKLVEKDEFTDDEDDDEDIVIKEVKKAGEKRKR